MAWEQDRLSNRQPGLHERFPNDRGILQQAAVESGLQTSATAQSGKRLIDGNDAVPGLVQRTTVVKLFENQDIMPVLVARRFLAADQVGQGQEGKEPAAIRAFLTSGIGLGERRQEMIVAPELQPLIAAIGQLPQKEALERARTP